MNEFPIKDAVIQKIYKSTTNREGQPYMTKPTQFSPNGRPFTKVDIYLDKETVDDMSFTGRVSMIDFEGQAADWEEGTKITGMIKKNGDFWNFELPKQLKGDSAVLQGMIDGLREDVDDLLARVAELEGHILPSEDEDEPGELDDEALPF